MDTIQFRPASPVDVIPCTDLLYATEGKFADYLFGAGSAHQAQKILAGLFMRPRNRFSHQFTLVAEFCGEIAGLLLTYPSHVLKKLELPTARHLLSLFGTIGMARFIRRAGALVKTQEAGPGENFINSVAVFEKFRGKGIGGALMGRAEAQAKTGKLTKCSLWVAVENVAAQGLYRKLGYQIAQTYEYRALERQGIPGFHRMIKNLD